MGLFSRRSELPRAYEFRSFKIDPVGELQALEDDANELRRKEQEDDEAIIPSFDAGSYRPGRAKVQARPSDQALLYLHELDQLTECTGIPLRINRSRSRRRSSIKYLEGNPSLQRKWYSWLLRSLHSHDDSLFIRFFGRIGIAQLPQDIAEKLCRKLGASIAFWRNRNALTFGEENADNRSIAIDELRLALTAQSHMTVRMTDEEAVRAFQLGVQIAGDASRTHRWVIEAAGELAKYALEAIPFGRRASMVLDVIEFPLANERGGRSATWPELIRVIREVKPQRDLTRCPLGPADRRTGDRGRPDANGRIEATDRLSLSRLTRCLEAERERNFCRRFMGQDGRQC